MRHSSIRPTLLRASKYLLLPSQAKASLFPNNLFARLTIEAENLTGLNFAPKLYKFIGLRTFWPGCQMNSFMREKTAIVT